MKLYLPFKEKYPVTQRFGDNPDYYSAFGLPAHNGIDYGMPIGTDILAAADGFIMDARMDNSGYGLLVKIDHGEVYTLYAHLSSFCVEVGNAILAGNKLGLSGNTGNSTGPHLHFGVRKNNYDAADKWKGWVDPAIYLSNGDGAETGNPVVVPAPVAYGRIRSDIGLNVRAGAGVMYELQGRLPDKVTVGYFNIVEDNLDLWLDLGEGLFCAAVYQGQILVDL